MKNKIFLIAGACGFVPSHVAQFYLEQGAKVIGIDNFITGSRENLTILKKYDHFSCYEWDLIQGLPPEIKKIKADYVLSLASPASPIDFKKIPLEIMLVNSQGTKFLLDYALEHGSIFLEASTSEVYGDPEIHPQVESYWGNVNPIGVRSCYDESKRFAEALTMTYNRRYQLETRIVRIFNTYGPRMRPDDGRVIPNFINQALAGEPLTVYGDGSQTRSYCFVTDLVAAMDKVLMSSDPMPFNIGNTEELTILATAQQIIKILGSSSKIDFQPLPHDDPRKRRPDLGRVMKIGYQPKVSFEQGIKQTVEFFKSL